ncbi:MAG: histidine--tRNA ligase [Bacteroidetes bacterium]|nr:MAG: histidine--tRNA ligase [Bacteroidota bacterium]
MGVNKVSVPKGTRDFAPLEMSRRGYIFSTIKRIFGIYGYQPLETPSMENLSTLLGKYGEEGDKLLFRILNSGDFLRGLPVGDLSDIRGMSPEKLAPMLCDKGLRYDLTVPFARFVSQNWHELPKPFKRYQIQPVWRADRPQKGRYREFYQCDIDVVGSNSQLCEVELVQVVEDVFGELGLKVELRFNNRKALAAMAEAIGHEELLIPITVAIDKYDKIGLEGVKEELASAGVSPEGVAKISAIVQADGSNEERLQALAEAIGDNPKGQEGMAEIRELLALVEQVGVKIPVILDLSLARGLNYYTGAIFEVKTLDCKIGSVCGGGRYDNLTGIFGLKDVSGVGISFGADRIYDAMLELSLFPEDVETSLDVLILNLGEEEVRAGMAVAVDIRRKGLRVMVFPDGVKFKKQMDYANRQKATWVVIIGSDEMARGEAGVKNMHTGEQSSMPMGSIAQWLQEQTHK